jgi:hypothetical protein
LALFVAHGGLSSDLEIIRDAGLEVEAQELAKSTAAGKGVLATEDAMLHFAATQKEYVAIMSSEPSHLPVVRTPMNDGFRAF